MGGVNYLKKFVDWIEAWEKIDNTKYGLSKETFQTCKQTCKGLIGSCIYLLEEKGFEYVLLGKINSDKLEGRFGWWRQLAGANYFMAVRQILESEKKIMLALFDRY